MIKVDLDAVSDGWWDWNLLEPEYEYLSPRFWQSLGYDPKTRAHSPSSWKSIIHQGDLQRAEAAIPAHIDRGEPYHMLVRYLHAKGHWVWIVCRGQVVRDDDGKPTRMIGVHQDVTCVVQRHTFEDGNLSESSQAMLASVERFLGILAQVPEDAE